MEAPDSLTVTYERSSSSLVLEEIAHEGVGFARGGAVADGDGFDAVLLDQRLERALGAGGVVLRGWG